MVGKAELFIFLCILLMERGVWDRTLKCLMRNAECELGAINSRIHPSGSVFGPGGTSLDLNMTIRKGAGSLTTQVKTNDW